MSKNPSGQEIINTILKQYHTELLLELDKANTILKLKRISDSGKPLEIAIKALLARVLPDYVGITRGIIFDSNCEEHSKEIDLILYDKRYFNGFVVDNWGDDSLSFVSIDVVFGVISVKKKLTRAQLKEAIENISSVYNLYSDEKKNQLHFDLKLGESLVYKEGKVLNKIFSCILSFENEYFYKNKSLKNESEINRTLDKLSCQTWFNGTNVDLIYTLDGTLFYPCIYNSETNRYNKTWDLEGLGNKKMALEPFLDKNKIKINADNIILMYSYNMDSPYDILGTFIAYIQYYCSNLVKSTPDIKKVFDNYLNLRMNSMMKERDIKKLQVKNKPIKNH